MITESCKSEASIIFHVAENLYWNLNIQVILPFGELEKPNKNWQHA